MVSPVESGSDSTSLVTLTIFYYRPQKRIREMCCLRARTKTFKTTSRRLQPHFAVRTYLRAHLHLFVQGKIWNCLQMQGKIHRAPPGREIHRRSEKRRSKKRREGSGDHEGAAAPEADTAVRRLWKRENDVCHTGTVSPHGRDGKNSSVDEKQLDTFTRNIFPGSKGVNCSNVWSTTTSYWPRKAARFSWGKFAKAWTSYTGRTFSTWTWRWVAKPRHHKKMSGVCNNSRAFRNISESILREIVLVLWWD